jgi:hypothetical protein
VAVKASQADHTFTFPDILCGKRSILEGTTGHSPMYEVKEKGRIFEKHASFVEKMLVECKETWRYGLACTTRFFYTLSKLIDANEIHNISRNAFRKLCKKLGTHSSCRSSFGWLHRAVRCLPVFTSSDHLVPSLCW